jgi:zinc transport system substrate-binding protein
MKRILFLLYFCASLFAYDVTVSILPQKFIINQIANNKVQVNVMIPPGGNPVTYSPKPKQLIKLKNSKIYFTIGVPFEKAWIDKFTSINPKIRIIYFGKNLKTDKNPHIWLDPIFLISEAQVVTNALSEIDPKNTAFYHKDYKKLIKKLQKTDITIQKMLQNKKQRKFIIFHPNLYYFAKRYSLKEIAIEKNGKEPSIRYLLKIINIAKKEHIKVIFASPEFSQQSADFIAHKVDAKIIEFSALKYNIIQNLLDISKILYEYN